MAPSLFSSKKSLEKPGPVKKLFTRDDHTFKFHREANIDVSSPNCGPSGQIGNLNKVPTGDTPAAELFPTLSWHFIEGRETDAALVERLEKVVEYLIIVQDLDGSVIGAPPATGIYYCIPPKKNLVGAGDIVKAKKGKLERLFVAERGLLGGFKYGDLHGTVWKTPKSMHRIHFQVIALSRTVDSGSLSEFLTIRSFDAASEGSVLGWGEWVGVYEKK